MDVGSKGYGNLNIRIHRNITGVVGCVNSNFKDGTNNGGRSQIKFV
jgi:hypothetical protein